MDQMPPVPKQRKCWSLGFIVTTSYILVYIAIDMYMNHGILETLRCICKAASSSPVFNGESNLLEGRQLFPGI